MAALDELVDSTEIIGKIEQRARALLPNLLTEQDKAEHRWQDAVRERLEVEVEASEQKRLLEEQSIPTRDVTSILIESERRIEFYQDLLLGYQGKVQALERKFTKTEETAFIWARELRRRSVIAYCTAFENFLRDFLIEQIVFQPARLERHLQKKSRISLKLENSINVIEIDDCISVECQAFPNLRDDGQVQRLYHSILGKKPFARFYWPNRWFTSKNELVDGYTDVQILFALRHEFVHRKGLAGRQYQLQMSGDEKRKGISYQNRIDPVLISWYPKSVPPNPDEVLDSRPISVDYRNKLDEMANSLLQYAKYIQEVCAIN